MPKITVQVARQRYARVPVIDSDTGQQKKVQVNRKRRRSDAPVFKPVFVNDKNQPLPPRKCEKCDTDLKIGEKYKSIGIKRQYGGVVRYRCMSCPTWQPWEYSDSLSARIQQIQNMQLGEETWETADDAETSASEVAEAIRELASEKEEAADNMEEGFGHETSQSEEIREQAQQLNDWADEVEQAGSEADFPEEADEEETCSECEGSGTISYSDGEYSGEEADCENCDGNGTIERDESEREQALEDWRQEAADAIRAALDNSPI